MKSLFLDENFKEKIIFEKKIVNYNFDVWLVAKKFNNLTFKRAGSNSYYFFVKKPFFAKLKGKLFVVKKGDYFYFRSEIFIYSFLSIYRLKNSILFLLSTPITFIWIFGNFYLP